jgi:hypothetical protein
MVRLGIMGCSENVIGYWDCIRLWVNLGEYGWKRGYGCNNGGWGVDCMRYGRWGILKDLRGGKNEGN